MLTINNTLDGYLKDVEVLGNTIQAEGDLADIRSVGDTVEGQELYEIPVLSCGKNLYKGSVYVGKVWSTSTVVGALWDKTQLITNNGYTAFDMFEIPNHLSQFAISSNGKMLYGNIKFFDKDKKYIKDVFNEPFVIPEGAKYCCGHFNSSYFPDAKIQIEEGTQATPYEPYIEDKLTILSPTPLEKVGDVADRVVCKDGVWGVEKNIIDISLKGLNEYPYVTRNQPTDTSLYRVSLNIGQIAPKGKPLICNRFINDTSTYEKELVSIHSVDGNLDIVISKTKASDTTTLNTWLQQNNLLIKAQATTPQFIPLPHDQQIKLRTFANKTNISFLTEIEGTIKAQVPKSLGATVNTHTEQINNLNKELDRVKKLEESTVSTVTTESDFTTVEATSNGYFEDVKLEGKTLVNLIGRINWGSNSNDTMTYYVTNERIINNISVTITNPSDRTVYLTINYKDTNTFARNVKLNANETKLVEIKSNEFLAMIYGNISDGWSSTNKAELKKLLILEGDHTQNPPNGYIEGLKSVGQDVDEVSVESVNENLFDVGSFIDFGLKQVGKFNFPINLEKNTTYTFSDDVGLWNASDVYIDLKNKDDISVCGLINPNLANRKQVTFTTDSVGGYCLETYANNIPRMLNITTNFMLNEGATPKPYTPHQSDKKRLLYYNEETQTWEKPILRQWDSIEKHADGKYYYHQRSGEVVLNGSEGNWSVRSVEGTEKTSFGKVLYGSKPCENHLIATVICDKFTANSTTKVYECLVDGVAINKNSWIYFSLNSELANNSSTFNQWLQANNVTVVYQLAQEKVYECTNIDLITYVNETNYIVESGAIAPRSTLKVHSNISNVVSLLQKKVSLLESNVKASQEVQDMMILETDMRMLDIELALMEFVPMKLNLGGSSMLRSATYFNFLKNHIINETYEKEYLENVMNKYLATGRINQDEYDELYNMLYPPVYDIELPIEL